MATQYTHLELGKEVQISIAGSYVPQKEVRLKYDGHEVLYVIGQAVVECSCCSGGSGNWQYAIVPGFILNWQSTRNEAGQPVSEVEPISAEETRENIRKMIQAKETTAFVNFW
ncbi:MAG: hypothetical protein ABIH70_08275 [Chloroflexota bacterium]